MKTLKKILIVSLILISVNITVFANDYIDNRDWYESTCMNTDLSTKPENKTKCEGYRKFLTEETTRLEEEIKDQKLTIETIRANIKKYVNEIEIIKEEIPKLQARIETIKENIIKIENNIEKLDEEIEVLENEIVTLEDDIFNVMVAMQSATYFDVFLDFLMASNDFVDLMTKMSIINDFNEYNKELINIRNKKIEEVVVKLDEQIAQRDMADKNKKELELQEESLTIKKENYSKIVATYQIEEAEIESMMTLYQADVSALKDQIHRINFGQIPASNGWIRPIKGGYISATAFYYPASFGGGVHLGTDYTGTGLGSNLLAVANGVVLFSANACPNYGGYPSSCGYPGSYGGGNQVYLVVSVDNKTYGIRYLHLKRDTAIEVGTVVYQGDKVGEMGSSGSSTGPHLHIEIIYLGTMSIESYVRNWNGDFGFGASFGSAALNHRCVVNGYKAPCRIAPQTILP